MQVGQLEIELLANVARLSRDMEKAKGVTGGAMDQIERRVQMMARTVAVSAAAAGAAIAAMAMHAAKSMDATSKMAQQIGVTTEALTGMRFAAQQFASISDQQFDQAMRRMTRRIEEAAAGSGSAKKALEEMGLSAQELSRMTPDRQMLALADAMKRTESQANRLRYTMAIFDTEGMALVPALQQGAAAFEENIKLAERYGVVLSTEAAQAAEQFNTNLSQLGSMMDGLKIQLASEVLPTLNSFITNVIQATTEVDGLHSEVKSLSTNSAFKEWFDASLVGLARIADVAVFVAKSVGAVGLAFQAAAADVQAGLAWIAKPNAADKLLMPAEDYNRLVAEYDAAMNHQAATVGKFNQTLDDLLTYQGNRFEQAALTAINTIRVTSDKITTVDLTVGGDSAGASEEQLKKLAEWMSRLATPTEKLEETLAKAKAELGALYSPEIERRIRAQFAARQQNTKSLTDAQKAAEAFRKEQERSLIAQYQSVSALHQQAQGLEDQVALFGMSKTAIEDLTIARLEEEAVALRMYGDRSKAAVEAIEREIEARKRLRTAIGSLEQKEAERQAWEDWARDVEQIFNRVGQSLTDAIFDGGKSGKELLKDVFKGLTFNVLINPVMQAGQQWVTQQLGGLFGYQNPQQQQSRSGGFSFGSPSTFGAGGVEYAGDLLLRSGLAPETGAKMLMNADKIAKVGGSILSYGSAIYDLSQGKYGSAAGTAIGQALGGPPGAMIGNFVGGLVDGLFDREPTTRRGQRTTIDYAGDAWGITQRDDRQAAGADAAARELAQAAVETANQIFQQVGVDAAIDSFYAIMESSIKGDRDGVASGGTLRLGDELRQFGIGQSSDMTLAGFGGWSDADMLPRLATDIQLSVLEAFQAVGDQLPSVLSAMLEGIDVRSLGEAEAQALAERFTALTQGAAAFLSTLETTPFAELRNLSFDAAAAMVQFAGGIDNLLASQQTYFENFYSEAERHEYAIGQITQALSSVGVEMPAITGSVDEMKAAYRALVESQDLNTEAGQQAYVTLMQVSGAFADVAQYAGTAAEAVRNAADVAREREGLERQLLQLQGDTAELRRRELEALDESNRALQQHIWNLERQAAAAQERAALEMQLLALVGNTAEIRRRELAALDESNRGVQKHIWALEDQAAAAQEAAAQHQRAVAAYQEAVAATNAAWRVVQEVARRDIGRLQETFTVTDSVYRALTKSIDVQRTALNEQIRASESLVAALRGTVDLVRTSVRELRGGVDSTAQMQYQQAMAVIRQAAGGTLPDTDRLAEAIASARGVTEDAGQYSSAFERDFAMLSLANELEKVQLNAEPQLTTQEQALEVARQQLTALENTLTEIKTQIDVMRGVDDTLYEQVLESIKIREGGVDQLNKLGDIDLNTFVTEKLMADLVKAQKDEEAARVQIEGINAQLDLAQQQYDQLRGLNTKGTTMIQALNNLATAMEAQRVATPTTPPPGTAPQLPTTPGAPTGPGLYTTRAATAGLSLAEVRGKRAYKPETMQEWVDYVGYSYSPAQPGEQDLKAEFDRLVAQGVYRNSMAEMERFGKWHYETYGYNPGRAYAKGGYYPGGLALVGEEGPEIINFARPGQVYTADQTQDILRNMGRGNDSGILQSILAENKALRAENKAHAQAIVQLNTQIMRILRQWDGNGIPETRELVEA